MEFDGNIVESDGYATTIGAMGKRAKSDSGRFERLNRLLSVAWMPRGTALSDALGVGPDMVSKWRAGKHWPRQDNIRRMADVLGLPHERTIAYLEDGLPIDDLLEARLMASSASASNPDDEPWYVRNPEAFGEAIALVIALGEGVVRPLRQMAGRDRQPESSGRSDTAAGRRSSGGPSNISDRRAG